MPDYKPRLYIELEGGDLKLLEKVKTGKTGRFVLVGKVVGTSERTNEDGKKRGTIDIEGYEISAVEANADFEMLLDE